MQHKSNLIIKFFLIFSLVFSLFLSLFLTNPNDNVLAQEPTPEPEAEPRIVGGEPASPGDWPWQVALINTSEGITEPEDFYFKQFCGGSIVNEYWILTAAHCVTEDNGTQTPTANIDIVAGIYNLYAPVAGYQRRAVAQIIRYPYYNTNNLDHDLALIRLSTPLTIGGSGETATAIVNLPLSSIGSLTGIDAWVTGWGRIDPPQYYDPKLYEVEVPIISNANCSLYWGGLIAGNLCAGDGTGEDSCFGDSGGPLVINQSGQWIIAGVVSSGSQDCGDYPGIYTRISYYSDWISAYIMPAQVTSITRSNTTLNPTNSTIVYFNINFSDSMTGVDISDFVLTTTGVSGANITNVSGSTTMRSVTVNTGTGSGTIRLDVVDNDTILSSFSIPLGGTGAGNGNYNTGETLTIDKTPPTVTSITKVDTNPTSNMLNVSYTVTFSESVTGVDVTDFTLNTTGVAGATVSNVSGSGNTRVVSVNTGQGDGTIRLDFVDNDSVTDLATNPTSAGYSGGQTYNIDKPELKAPILRSPRSGGATNDTTPNFIWQRVANAQSYEIQIDNNSDFSSLEDNSNGIIATNYTSIALAEGTYYWRVRGNNVSGNPGKWSVVRTITIDTTGPIAPTLISPSGTTTSRTLTFRWQPSSGAVQYELAYADDVSCTTNVSSIAKQRGTTRRLTNIPVGTYYWCVRAKDSLGNWGDWVSLQITVP